MAFRQNKKWNKDYKRDELTESLQPKPEQHLVSSRVRCPYVKSHIVGEFQYDRHVWKCRRGYMNTMRSLGVTNPVMTCKYNADHQIVAPELLRHQEDCEDRKKFPTHLIITQNRAMLEKTAPFSETVLGPFQFSANDLLEMYACPGGNYIDIVIGESTHGRQAQIEDLRNGTFVLEAIGVSGPEHLAVEQLTIVDSSTAGPSAGGANSSGLGLPKEGDKAKDDEEDWEGGDERPPYDYKKSLYNPSRPTFTYPPGLNKAQKRDFVDWNTKWMKNIAQQKRKTNMAVTVNRGGFGDVGEEDMW